MLFAIGMVGELWFVCMALDSDGVPGARVMLSALSPWQLWQSTGVRLVSGGFCGCRS